jgi:hypothetical protein
MKRKLLLYCMLIVASLLGTARAGAQSLANGYYYIKSAYTYASANSCVYDPQTADNVQIHVCQNSKADIFYLNQTEDGKYTLQNAATWRYVIKFTGSNCVQLSCTLEDGVYIVIDYIEGTDGSGVYRWKDNTQSCYYNMNGTNLNGGAGLSSQYNYHDWTFEAVPSDVLESFELTKSPAYSALLSYYTEVSDNYSKMIDETYDDVALTTEQKTALANKIAECKELLYESTTATDADYTTMLAGLKEVYEKAPYVDGGLYKFTAMSVDDIKDGSQIMLEVGHPSYKGRYMVAYPKNGGNNSVMCDDTDQTIATTWKLVATGAYDAKYTSKPTYYMMDVASGKYFGYKTTNESKQTTDRKMVDETSSAYAFCFLTKEEIDAEEGTKLNTYNTTNPVFIHHTNTDGTWFRLSRYGSYTHVYYLGTGNDWQTWDLYSSKYHYNVSDELQQTITKYEGKTFANIGSDPGCFDESLTAPFTNAMAAAKAITSSNTRQEYRDAIDLIKSSYTSVKNITDVKPIVEGYYYIESAYTDNIGKNIVAYDPNDGTNLLAKHENANTAYDIFHLTIEADGQYQLQNLGSGLYVGQAGSSDNNVTLVENPTDGVYQTLTYDAEGQYKWKDNKTSFTYYINGNKIGRYYKYATGGPDSWYLRTVPQYVVDELTNKATFTVEDGSLVVTGTDISAKSISSAMTDNSTVTSLDLSAATLADAVTADELTGALTGNQVAILPATSALEGQNLVVDGKCSSLVLTDKANFAPATAFTATKVTYSKTGLDGAGWYSAVLPYSISVPTGMTVLNNATLGDGTITFDQVEAGSNIAANTPFIYKTADNTVAFEASDANIATSETLSSGDLLGTYTTIAAGSATGKLILNTEGSAFATATDKASIPAFRAYLNASASAKEFTIVINGETTGIATGEAINGTSETVDVYTIGGTLVRSHADAITALQGLPKGIYIVNGKKIAK